MKPSYMLVLLAGLLLALPCMLYGDPKEASWPLIIQFVDAGGEPPDVVELPHGTFLVVVRPIYAATGDLEGILSERVTQVYKKADELGFMAITSFWKLVTPDGTIEGYCSGQFNHLEGYNHDIQMHGEVLSVTGTYVDLYRAEVFYRAALKADHMSITGTLTIAPRRPFVLASILRQSISGPDREFPKRIHSR